MKKMNDIKMNEKKIIKFSVPLHFEQRIKISSGEVKYYLSWDLPGRLWRFIKGFLPRILTKEVGAKYATLREGYYWIGANGELERRELPEIDDETEELVINACLSISVIEDLTEKAIKGSVMDVELEK